jgi:acetolactate synthase I/II/III large subunit
LRTIDAIAEILKMEGIEFLSTFPSTPLIDAAGEAGIPIVVCRQERVGVGIADGFARATNGRRLGAFAMQYGPGIENAFPGVANAYSDSTPLLLLPLGHREDRQGLFDFFSATNTYGSVTKRVDRITSPNRTAEVMRRGFAALQQGRPGPVMIEIPHDVAVQEVDASAFNYRKIKRTVSQGDPVDVEAAARALCAAQRPVVIAGQGVLYSEATAELVELAELLSLPVLTTLLGKSAFPENHPLSIGNGHATLPRTVHHFLQKSDLVLGIGTSFTNHPIMVKVPAGKTLIQITDDPRDVHKDHVVDYPVIGDARLVLRQLLEAVRDIVGNKGRPNPEVPAEIASVHDQWLRDWEGKLTSQNRPINPFRIIREFQRAIDPADAIVTHECGNSRFELAPFYQSAGPRSFIGWGKSHGLGTGLGLIMGAKLAFPEKVCLDLMGDAAFGMVGLDFETAVRNRLPIIVAVLNNGGMCSEERAGKSYDPSPLGGNYADLGRALGGHAERVEDPEDVFDAFRRARRVTEEEGLPVLLEFMSATERDNSWMRTNFAPASAI